MYKIYNAILKELILLKRDLFGLVIIFLMPVILILTITPIQYSIENRSENLQFPALLINNDKGELSQKMIAELSEKRNLKFITTLDNKPLTKTQGKELIKNGKQQILIMIPADFSEDVQNKIHFNVNNLLTQVMPDYDADERITENKGMVLKSINIYFDPIVDENVKSEIRTSINQMTADMEAKMIYESFEKEFEADLSFIKDKNLIPFEEVTLKSENSTIKPTPIQHNMPAWVLFAIFLIVIPLSITIVKEKDQGTYIRLKTLPVSRFYLMLSKIIVFLIVCMVQFYLMLLVSVYVFPIMDMPALEISGKLFQMSLVALFSGLAAIGFGVLIGTIAKTHEQSAPFGATSVVIFAAVGGLWFPVYAMSPAMQKIARISPMNWGLEGFYNVLLRNSGFLSLTPYLSLLLSFFIVNIAVAVFYEKKVANA